MSESILEKFTAYFNEKVIPEALSVEKYRKAIITIFSIWGILVLTITVLIEILLLPAKFSAEVIIPSIFAIIIPTIVLVVSPLFFVKGIIGLAAKRKILPVLLGFWGNFSYLPPANYITAILDSINDKSGFQGIFQKLTRDKRTEISVKPAVLANLLKFENIIYDDKVIGEHSDIKIELCELKTYYETQNDKGEKTKTTTFKGVIFSAQMNKNFKGKTIISNCKIDKHRAERPSLNFKSIELSDMLEIGQKLADAAKKYQENPELASQEGSQEPQNRNQEKIQDVFLEDPLFTKKFHVCSNDQIEARYILTTAFMNRFLRMSENFGYKTKAIFMDNNVYILVDIRKNWFEIPFFKSCTTMRNYSEFVKDFTNFLSIVETLKLNQNIGM